MALFSSMFPQRPIAGAAAPQQPYNVPVGDIRPGQNQVNINGNAETSRGDAFAAFSRLYMPLLQNNANMITGLNARPIDAQGNPIPGAPQQYGPQDFNQALQSMFQRGEDLGTMSRYSGFSPALRRQPSWG